MLQVSGCFEDDNYLLLEFLSNDDVYIFLYDKTQESAFLGIKEEPIEPKTFWERHRDDKNYCLPCELMLYFKKRLAIAKGYPPLEMGLFWIDVQVLLKEVDKLINLPRAIRNTFKI